MASTICCVAILFLRLIDKLLDARRDVLTRPQPVPMSSGLVWSTVVPRCAVRRGRAFPAGERSREELVASIQKLRHRQNTTYRSYTSIIPQYSAIRRVLRAIEPREVHPSRLN